MGINSGYFSIPGSRPWYLNPRWFQNIRSQKGYRPRWFWYLRGTNYSPVWTVDQSHDILNKKFIVKRRTWDAIQKYELPEGAKIISGTWDLKCKRFPHGSFWRFKAQFCVRGYIQKRICYVPMNAYAPVLQCSVVRLMLVLTCAMGLNTQATDFRNYFA